MSDAVLPVRSNSIYAMLFLVLSFAAGPLLVYSIGTGTPPVVATPSETDAPTPIPPADLPGSTGIETDSHAQRVDTDARLTEARTEIHRLEQNIAGLREQQKQLQAAFAAHLERVTRTRAEAEASAEPAEEPQTNRPNGLENDLARLGAGPTERGRLVTLTEAELRFPVGRSELARESSDGLREIADVLAGHEGLVVRIEGHTDRSGSPSRNLALSQARARSVKDALVAMGIDADRIETEGVGETRPLADNDTAEARQRNRRVEVYLIAP